MSKKVVLIITLVLAVFFSTIQPFSIYADSFSDNYYELSYLTSSGSEYLISSIPGVYGKFEIEAEFQSVNATTTYQRYVGCQVASNNLRVPLVSRSSKIGFGYVSTYKNEYSYSANVSYIFETVLVSGSNTNSTFKVDNSLIVSQNYATAQTAGSNVYMDIFGYYQSTTNTHTPASSMTLYYLKRWDINGNLTHYYIPAMRKSDSKVGLYNQVNGEFIYTSNDNFSYPDPIPSRYTITTSVSPSGAGSVTGGGEYDANSTVTLTATPNTGYSFIRWSDNVYDNPRTVVVTQSQSYQAIFQQQSTPVDRYTLSLSVSPSGSGTVSGGGEYDAGSNVTITATANNGYQFSQWSDGNTDSTRVINLNSNLSLTAQFIQYIPPAQTYTVNVSANPNQGTVTGGGTYELNQIATITANALPGYVFASWSDGITANPRQIQVTSNISLTAYFTQDVSNQIILGVNMSLIDYESNDVYQYWGSDDGTKITFYPAAYDGSYPTGGTPLITNPSQIVTLDFVFNDDYIGSFGYTFYEPGGANIDSRTLYVNGSHASISFLYSSRYILTNSTITFRNLNNLVKKQSVTSGIYEGTQESIESEQALDNSNEDLSSTVNEFDELETGFNDDMNDALDDINTDVSLNDFGADFQSSAVWVSQQFNRLTANTPFGSVLGFSLLLGLSLLIIGKVLG